MSEHKASIRWTHSQGDFLKGSYSREHTWSFDGGVTVPASPSPTSVKPPYSNAANVDPEEALRRRDLELPHADVPVGRLPEGSRGDELRRRCGGCDDEERARHPLGQHLVLRPRVTYVGTHPSQEAEEEMHHNAHESCYIANSVKTDITVDRGYL